MGKFLLAIFVACALACAPDLNAQHFGARSILLRLPGNPNSLILEPPALTGNRTFTFPDASGTLLISAGPGLSTAWLLGGNSIIGPGPTSNRIGTLGVTDFDLVAGGVGNIRLSLLATQHAVVIPNAGELRFEEPGGGNFSALKAGTQVNNITYTLPLTNGNAGDVLRIASSPAPTANSASMEWQSMASVSPGTTVHTTLRWNGSAWVENAGVLADALNNLNVTGNLDVDGTATVGAMSGVVKATAGLLSAGNVNLTTEVTGTLPVGNGGTGLVSVPAGNLVYGALASPLTPLANPVGNAILMHNGTIPSWTTSVPTGITIAFDRLEDGNNGTAKMVVDNGASIELGTAGAVIHSNVFLGTGSTTNAIDLATAEVAGTLPVANGGTGITTLAAGALAYGAGTSPLTPLTIGTANQVLRVNAGGTAPQWATINLLPTGTTNNATLRWNTATTEWVENTGVLSNGTSLIIPATTNQIVLGTTNTTTINSVAPAASRTYTIPDAGANANFVMTESNQTINGDKTITGSTAISGTTTITGTTSINTANELRFSSVVGGSNYTAFKGGTQLGNISYTLPTTAPTANQVLRANATTPTNLEWATPTSTSGATFSRLSSAVTTTSTTLVNLTGLSASVSANKNYEFSIMVGITRTNGSPDARLSFTFPSAAAISYAAKRSDASSNDAEGALNTATVSEITFPLAGSIRIWVVTGVLTTGANSGTFQVQYRLQGGGGSPEIQAETGSYLILKEL